MLLQCQYTAKRAYCEGHTNRMDLQSRTVVLVNCHTKSDKNSNRLNSVIFCKIRIKRLPTTVYQMHGVETSTKELKHKHFHATYTNKTAAKAEGSISQN